MEQTHSRLAQAISSSKAPPAGVTRGIVPVGSLWGVVSSVQTGPPPSLTISLSGSSTTVAGVRYLNAYRPTVGDTVLLAQMGNDYVVVDKIAANSSGNVLGQLTSTQLTGPGIVGSYVTINGLTGLTVTVPANHRIKLTLHSLTQSTVAGDGASVAIMEGATFLNQGQSPLPVANTYYSTDCVHEYVPSAGSHTYFAQIIRMNGSGSMTNAGIGSAPSFLLCEDIGG